MTEVQCMTANKRRNIAIIMCILFSSVMLASFIYIVSAENHQCEGEDCQVCACVQQAEHILEQLGNREIYNGIELPDISVYSVALCFFMFFIHDLSLVSMKVRLND